jgi:hypothetical protein
MYDKEKPRVEVEIDGIWRLFRRNGKTK